MDVLNAIKSRRSTRAFLDKPVSPKILTMVLEHARWAPSGVNTQPWQVAVVSGSTKQTITDALLAARNGGVEPNPDYPYYPTEWVEPYKSRRLETGLALYGALKIGKQDKEKRLEAWYNNYRFFHAPVGLFFFIDNRLAQGSWVDMGMFIQNVMLAALDLKLATCPQASLAEYPDLVRTALSLPENLKLVCGMSLGYPDADHPVNNYYLPRMELGEFVHWYD